MPAGGEQERQDEASHAADAEAHVEAQAAEVPNDQQGRRQEGQHDERRAHLASLQASGFRGQVSGSGNVVPET
jgi:hypothetical protein